MILFKSASNLSESQTKLFKILNSTSEESDFDSSSLETTSASKDATDKDHVPMKRYITIEDSVDYRTIAKNLSAKGEYINHARVRALYLRGMERIMGKLIDNTMLAEEDFFIRDEENNVLFTKEQLESMLRAPELHELIQDALAEYSGATLMPEFAGK